MASVDHVAERAHRSLGLALEPGAPDALAIHHGDLLARPQIRYRLGAQGACDPIRNAAAGATAIKAEHQAGTFSRPAMVERIDAECPMGADQPRLDPLQELKAWPPHQGTIAEDPDVVGIGHWVHPRLIFTKTGVCGSGRYGQSGGARERFVLGNAAFPGFQLRGDS